MKQKKGNAGFTLIELLAVIVVLAIVAVLGTTTVMPLLEDIRLDTFAKEANDLKSAGSSAVSLIMLGKDEIKGNYTTITNGYCFTLENLKAAGLYEKDDTNYQGIVKATKAEGSNVYTYDVSLGSDKYFTHKTSGNFSAEDVKLTKEEATGYVESCS